MAPKRDYYEVLGVPKDADAKAIKQAFRDLAKKYHPDQSQEPDAEERFKEIGEAYGVLSSPDKRAAYDARGFAGVGSSQDVNPFAGIDLEDILSSLGGFGGFGGGIFDAFGGRPRGPQRGQDIYIEIAVPLDVVLEGGAREVAVGQPRACPDCLGARAKEGTSPRPCDSCKGAGRQVHTRQQGNVAYQQVVVCSACAGRGAFIDDPCPTCQGRGEVRREDTLTVKIPKGIREGTAMRVPGRGRSSESGGPPGDLFVVVTSAPDPRFARRGDDLWRAETIDAVDAVLGREVHVPTLEGFSDVTVPPGTQPGAVLRLRGKGLPHFGTDQRGDMYLEMNVRIPRQLSADERDLYTKLRDLRRS